MRALAGYVMKGPLSAILVATAFALLSLVPILGMFSVFSAAAIALVTLRQGAKQGMLVLAGAAVFSGVFLQAIAGAMILGIVFALFIWFPVYIMALVLRRTVSWSITLDAAVAFSAFGVLVIYLVSGDPAQMWQGLLTSVIDQIAAQGGKAIELDISVDQISEVAGWLTGVVAAAVALSLLAGLMLGRWWQSLLYNPGGFREEFYGLRISRVAAVVVLATAIVSFIGLGGLSAFAQDLLIVAVVVYSIVGLALVHSSVASANKHVGWLVALYVLMFLMPPHVMLVLAGVALADSWLDFRTRLATQRSQGSNNQNDE